MRRLITATLTGIVGVGCLASLALAADQQATPSAAAGHLSSVTWAPITRGEVALARTEQRPALDALVAAGLRRQRLAADSMSIQARIRLLQGRQIARQTRHQAEILRLGYDPATTDPREIARQLMLNLYGWGADQFGCYDRIITQESRWRWNADNPRSSAYGIPQALPGSKMASAGPDWRTNPATQIRWGLGYVRSRYGTPCSAWGFKRSHGWY